VRQRANASKSTVQGFTVNKLGKANDASTSLLCRKSISRPELGSVSLAASITAASASPSTTGPGCCEGRWPLYMLRVTQPTGP
jgi:hypothetical protein